MRWVFFDFLISIEEKKLTLVLHFQLEVPPSIGGRKRYLETKKKREKKKKKNRKKNWYGIN
jgi:hypothetical protein